MLFGERMLIIPWIWGGCLNKLKLLAAKKKESILLYVGNDKKGRNVTNCIKLKWGNYVSILARDLHKPRSGQLPTSPFILLYFCRKSACLQGPELRYAAGWDMSRELTPDLCMSQPERERNGCESLSSLSGVRPPGWNRTVEVTRSWNSEQPESSCGSPGGPSLFARALLVRPC